MQSKNRVITHPLKETALSRWYAEQNIKERTVEHREEVSIIFRWLDRRQREIMTMLYGLEGREEMTYAEIGKALGIKPKEVKLIVDESFEKLKQRLDESSVWVMRESATQPASTHPGSTAIN